MQHTTQRLSIEMLSAGGPPSEFRIFTTPSVDTLKGVFVFDEAAAASVLQCAADWNNDFSLDYEHNAVNESLAGPKPAAGWYRIEVRAGELWAVDVRWTPRAAAMLTDREYRYVSPTFGVDETTNRITELVNVALTNLPATKAMTPLVASRLKEHTAMPTNNAAPVTLAADAELADPAATPMDPAADPNAPPPAAPAPSVKVDDSVMLGERSAVVVAVKTGDFAAVLFDDDKSTAWVPADKLAAPPSKLSDEEREAAVSQLLSMTGAKSVKDLLDIVAASKVKAVEPTAAERTAIVAKLKAERRITPALTAWAESVDIVALRAFANAAPVIANLAATRTTAPAGNNAKRWEDHTPMELHKLCASNPALYASLKTERDQRAAR